MRIGVPREVKIHEYRVGLVPAGVRELCSLGHSVVVETGAGAGIGFTDEHYKNVGAEIVQTATAVFEQADMIVKVKEPQASEYGLLRDGQILFTYLHLAPDPAQTAGLLHAKAIAIAYETVTDSSGGLPLLSPMSEVAGRMSIQVGATALQKFYGGSGILLGGVPGVKPAQVVILGGGVAGINAARMAVGLEAHVTVIDKSLSRLKQLDAEFGACLDTVFSTVESIEQEVLQADLVIGAVLVPGAAAPKLVSKAHLRKMKPGSVMVDLAIDQGGCFETSRPTTHQDPLYTEEGIVHYCVTNMPGAVARTSSFALNNATLPFVVALANKGVKQALREDEHLLRGLNVCKGHVTYKAVANDLGYAYVPPLEALEGA
ncbi:MAG: alanine dehydrogenase [Alphaproteobacteria bacterium]|nr:alanine dehydrogenase [Alphaproteobacteria bacterium]